MALNKSQVIGLIKGICGSSGGSSGSASVVILPEMTAEVEEERGVALITKPLSATPTEGATAKIVYNGVEYTSPILYITNEAGMGGYMMGNTDYIGIPGGNSDTPFYVSLMPDGIDGLYGVVGPIDDATTVTISITQEASSSGGNAGGGVALVKVSCETTDMQTFTNVTCDKTYAELKTSYDADGMLWCRFTVPGLGISAECACAAYDDAAFVFAPFGFLGDSGLEIAIKSDGTCEVYIA